MTAAQAQSRDYRGPIAMRIPIHRLLLVSASLACAVASAAASAQGWEPSSLEVIQLPRFCWAQFKVPGSDGPEFRIANCGPAANHYCFGLTYLLRAKKFTGKGKPVADLGRADTDVWYTEVSIKDYPQCSISGHVADTRAEINHLMRMYGIKPPRR
jgi:hypothetical protein